MLVCDISEPSNTNTWGIDEQFLWGSTILVSPVVHEVSVCQFIYNFALPTDDSFNESRQIFDAVIWVLYTIVCYYAEEGFDR